MPRSTNVGSSSLIVFGFVDTPVFDARGCHLCVSLSWRPEETESRAAASESATGGVDGEEASGGAAAATGTNGAAFSPRRLIVWSTLRRIRAKSVRVRLWI